MTTKQDNKPEIKAVASIQEANLVAAHTKYLHDQGEKIIIATHKTSLLYHELVCYIRKNSVPPRLVSEELMRLGFVKARASEVNRIANASDEVFSAYESKMIGMKAAIAMARQDPQTKDMVATPAVKLLEEKGQITPEDAEHALETETETGTARVPKSDKAIMDNHAKAIFKVAKKNMVWHETDADGILYTWKLVLTKIKPADTENDSRRKDRARVDKNRAETGVVENKPKIVNPY